MKVGIFGGVFNPFHKGHLNTLNVVSREMGLDEIRVLPCYQSVDASIPADSPSPHQRLEMLKEELAPLGPQVVLDDVEIRRGGKSYSIDTLEAYQLDCPHDEFYIIIGVDQFEVFDTWKDYESILRRANLIVTSRVGWDFEACFQDPPEGVVNWIAEKQDNKMTLKTSRSIQFLSVGEMDLSSSKIRKLHRSGMSISGLVSSSSEKFLKEGEFYRNKKTSRLTEDQIESLPGVILDYFYKKSSAPVLGFDLSGDSEYVAEYVFVVTVSSSAMAESEMSKVEMFLKDGYKISPLGREEGVSWSILDYGYIMIHFMSEAAKSKYDFISLFNEECLIKREDRLGS